MKHVNLLPKSKLHRSAILFFAAWMLFFALFLPGKFFISDAWTTAITARQINMTGSIGLNQQHLLASEGRGGDLYIRHAILFSFVMVPFDLVAMFVDAYLPQSIGKILFPKGSADFFLPIANNLFSAGLLIMLFYFLISLKVSQRIAFITVLSAGISTMILPYSRDLFRHPLDAIFIFGALIILKQPLGQNPARRSMLLGTILGLMVLNRHASQVFMIIYAVLFLIKLRLEVPKDKINSVLAPFAAACYIGVFLHYFSIWYRWGSPIYNFSVGQSFDAKLTQSIPRFLFSPEAGMLVYCPLWIFLVWAIPHAYKKGEWFITTMILMLTLAHLVLFGSYHDHYGGVNPGPRYLYALVPLWFVLLGLFAEKEKKNKGFWIGWVCLACLGALFNIYESLTDYTTARSAGTTLMYFLTDIPDDLAPWSPAHMMKGYWARLFMRVENQWTVIAVVSLLLAGSVTLFTLTWRGLEKTET